ncbi:MULTISPECIES: very short patch repair endonuclease [Bacillus]|uniref:very short patch repair endonuclease n=1 Tax=Bacillus TaxID=1386 RepID=UPI001E3C75BD|nr:MULTISPECIES: very short patch repair endonuclease [Bacillus]MCC9090184.1 very short patch repair endonuclease [Bacillus pumilus]MED1749625.1 very short patch repair endonuclease [Bacillus zhangzhouensis]
MTDNLTPKQRRKNMQAIRSQSKLENRISKEIWRRGIRFRKNDRTLFGKPDISIKKYKVVIFIDSCFWHGCEIHGNRPKSNQEYWDKKLKRNRKRDEEVRDYYKVRGWNYKRVWEHEFKGNFDKAVGEIEAFIRQAQKTEP